MNETVVIRADTREFDGKKYAKASAHQKEWETKLISEFHLEGNKMKRRSFLKIGGGAFAAAVLPSFADETPKPPQNILRITPINIKIGLPKPVRALHFSDTHLCYADERENDRKRALAANRVRYFGKGPASLDASLAYAKERNELVLHTGDLIDFVSAKNLEVVKEKFSSADCILSAGNHEFSQYVGEAKEDDAYKAQSYARVQRHFPNDLTFYSRTVGGVNFVALDDVYHNLTANELELFKGEVAKGLPIILLCHCPLYTQGTFDAERKHHQEELRRQPAKSIFMYQVGVPPEKTTGMIRARRPDEPTQAFIDYLKKQPLLKAILCGHLHLGMTGTFSETATEYVAGPSFNGEAQEITIT